MSDLTFARLHEHLVQALPELSRPMALMCEDDIVSENGVPLQYLGTSWVLEVYLDVLLALRPSPLRDAALTRAFVFVDAMFAAEDQGVVGFADIQLIEGQRAWWFQRAQPFLGAHFLAILQRWKEAGWTQATAPDAPVYPPVVRLHDLYEVRPTIAGMLAAEGITLADLLAVEHTP
ncbi:hypothetical protein LAJ19_16635 (plasmid) [Deinococcus taeanensis]|uniref:hypothetical protein n=1 Tax=Deinococcus taeanensis TaxID=2737050 RepID=UPI001CDC6F77|nr:hypothetical protein [Deinococcus taeanensis]UBV44773.1 hypothetical protein LAJ19_16635 [Deinococcus taeanensis]